MEWEGGTTIIRKKKGRQAKANICRTFEQTMQINEGILATNTYLKIRNCGQHVASYCPSMVNRICEVLNSLAGKGGDGLDKTKILTISCPFSA